MLELRNSPIHGKGLFATEDIPAGQRLIEYTGELIDRKEATRRDNADPNGITYIVEIDDEHFIDGAFGGNDFRYVNHSCDPNCTLVRHSLRVFLTSKRPIKAGEELTFDYAFDKNSPRQSCHCGSPNCRGTINETS